MRGAMIGPRWSKVTRDIAERPGRSLLAVIAMAAGVFAFGAMVFKYTILRPVLTNMYGETRPAAATLFTDRVDDAIVDSLRLVAGVAEVEARPVILARARVGDGDWVPAILYVIRDFDRQRMDLFKPNDGAWPPGKGDVLIERSAVAVAGIGRGDALVLRPPGGEERTLRFTGTVHAPGLAPAWMEHVIYGFLPWDSDLRRGGLRESAQVRIRVAEHALDEGHVREVADRVKARLERQGHRVTRVDVPTPGRHPHAAQMDTFLYLVGAFGALSFLLSSVLVASMIHALLAEQVKQVGIMKAIGATDRQIAGLYLGQVALLATGAMAVGIPLALVVGGAYARFSAGILNADVSRAPFPFGALLSVVAVGLLVPLLVAVWPVVRASRITVHRALNDDQGPQPYGSRGSERWLAGMAWLPRPLMLSLRTTFLRRGRLALTVVTLALGGALFTSALNVSGAWTHAVDQDFARRRYDLMVRLAEPQPIDRLSALLAATPGVEHGEYWPGASPYLIGPEGAAGSTVALVGPDPGSRLLDLRLVAGRWLEPGDSAAAVVNHAVLIRNPSLRVGETVGLRLEGRTIELPIVGVAKELSPMAVVYAPRRAVLEATGQSGETARSIRVVTREHTAAGQLAAAREIEQRFQREEIEVAGIQRMQDARKGIHDHLVILMVILTMASGIVVFVGGLGLTSTLTLSVVQRTREIGVLSAIGATPRTISGHVWFEGVVIGLMSWALAIVLAAPVSWGLGVVTGNMFFKAPLDFFMSPGAALLWLGLVLVLASLSSFYPAWRAARLTVREAIAHV
jgi:putative ABC transport system permease protein